LYYKEVVDTERSKANAEALLMEVEDEYMKGIMVEEKIMMKKENYLVRIFLIYILLHGCYFLFIFRCAEQKRA